MNQNPILMAVQMMNMGRNPMAVLQQFAGRDPRMAQVLQMMNGKNPQQLEEMVRNVARERGINLTEFAGSLGIKLPK